MAPYAIVKNRVCYSRPVLPDEPSHRSALPSSLRRRPLPAPGAHRGRPRPDGASPLPWDRLAVFRLDDPRLAVTLGGVRLPNPLILAAMYYDPRIIMRAMGLGFGAVTTKSITVEPRPGHPQPNLARVPTAPGPGLVNCNG